MANLEELANARRLRVTAVIPPQYNPIRPRLRPPVVEPRRFHSFASTLSPPSPSPSPAIVTWSRCSFHLSFRSLFAGAPRPITSSAPHPRRYASALFSLPFSLSSPPPLALSYSAFYFFPSASSFLPRARQLDLPSFLSLLRHFLLRTMGINEEHTSKQEKRRRLSCCKLKRTGAWVAVFFYGAVFLRCRRLRGWFRPRARFMVSQ